MSDSTVSDNLNLLLESVTGIHDHWDQVIESEELTERALNVLENVASSAYTIELLVKFNAIWLSDSEQQNLDDILSFVSTGIEELTSIF